MDGQGSFGRDFAKKNARKPLKKVLFIKLLVYNVYVQGINPSSGFLFPHFTEKILNECIVLFTY